MKCRVAIVHNTVAPYRHPLFEKLSQNLDLTVYYCSVKYSLRKWDSWPRNYDYKYKILSGILLKTSVGELNINPSVVKELFLNRPHMLVLGGYVNPTMWFAFAVGVLLKIPVIHWTEGTREPQSILGAITRPLRMLFLKKSNAVVVPGRLSRSYVISLGANAKKVFIAPNTIDNDLFATLSRKYQLIKGELKTRLGLQDKIVIIYVGQLIRRKGVSYLLKAYARIKSESDDVALVVLGSGPLRSHLEEVAKSLKLKDLKIMESGILVEELIKLYSTADIFVLPTLEDIWGFVINEAMACGLPVIATRASQAAVDMIRQGENGYVVKEADIEELYKALIKLVHDSELRKKMAKGSREIVEHEFNVNHMAVGFLSAIEYCIEKQ